MASPRSSWGTPIAGRPGDWLYVISFMTLAAFVFLVEPTISFGDGLAPDAWNPVIRLAYEYATAADPSLIERTLLVRVEAAIATLVFGPLYLVMVYAFIRGGNWVRTPALMWAVTLSGSTVVHGIVVLKAGVPIDAWLLAAGSLPFILVPVAVMVRVRKPEPFGQPPAVEACLPGDARDPEARRRA